MLKVLGVDHFVVNGEIPAYKGVRAHPRAYLDAMKDSGKTNAVYFERSMDEGRPNPRGDAASRVILKVGAGDYESVVHFSNGRSPMKMAEFIDDYVQGNL